MARDPEDQQREPSLPEDDAHRLLARAVELDARRTSQVSVAQLREIAREAGIAPEAFDEALSETIARSPSATEPTEPGLLRGLWHRWRGTSPPAVVEQPTSWRRGLALNGVAFAAFLMVARVLSRISGFVSPDWPLRDGVLLVATLLGFGVALRIRARATAVVLAVTAAAQLAEYAMHLRFGIQTVQGGPTKWAVMLAALIGMAFGAAVIRSRRGPPGSMRHRAVEPADATQPSEPRPQQSPSATLRLHTA